MSAPTTNTDSADETPCNKDVAQAVLDGPSQNWQRELRICLAEAIEKEEGLVSELSKPFTDFFLKGRPLEPEALSRFNYLMSEANEIESNQRIRAKLKAKAAQLKDEFDTEVDKCTFYSRTRVRSGSLVLDRATRELTTQLGLQPTVEQVDVQHQVSEATIIYEEPINNTEIALGHDQSANEQRADYAEALTDSNEHISGYGNEHVDNEVASDTEEYINEQVVDNTETPVEDDQHVNEEQVHRGEHIEERPDADQGNVVDGRSHASQASSPSIGAAGPAARRCAYTHGTKRLHSGNPSSSSTTRKRARPSETASAQPSSSIITRSTSKPTRVVTLRLSRSTFNKLAPSSEPLAKRAMTLQTLLTGVGAQLKRQICLYRGFYYFVECIHHYDLFLDRMDTLRAASMHSRMNSCLPGTPKMDVSFEEAIIHLGVHIVDCTLEGAIRNNRIRQLHIATSKIYSDFCGDKIRIMHISDQMINNHRLAQLDTWQTYAAFLGQGLCPIPAVALPVRGTFNYLRQYPVKLTQALVRNRPDCVSFNEETQEFCGWAPGYGDGEEMVSSRLYPVLGCGKGSYPQSLVLEWVSLAADGITPFDNENTGRSSYRTNLEKFIHQAKRDWEVNDDHGSVQDNTVPSPSSPITISSSASDTDMRLEPRGSSVDGLTADTAATTNSPETHLFRDIGYMIGPEDVKLPPMVPREDGNVPEYTTGTVVGDHRPSSAMQEPRGANSLSTTAQLAREQLPSPSRTGPWYITEYPLPGERRPEPPMGI